MNIIKLYLRKFFWKLLGSEDVSLEVNQLRDEMNTLHYFLNNFMDIKSVPPTKDPDLRILQLCDVKLLAIIDKVCKKCDLTYWLDYGTLLGAFRHKGIIPWDDDTDISMPRASYDRAEEILVNQLSQYGISVKDTGGRIGIGYQHEKTGIWVDIFPIEDYYCDKSLAEAGIMLSTKINKFLSKAETKSIQDLKELNNIIRMSIGNTSSSSGSNHFMYYCPRWTGDGFYIHNYSDVFPLKELELDDYCFPVPFNVEGYLGQIYHDYMEFPRSGVLHHGINMPLSVLARNNNVDMSEVLLRLQDIYDRI